MTLSSFKTTTVFNKLWILCLIYLIYVTCLKCHFYKIRLNDGKHKYRYVITIHGSAANFVVFLAYSILNFGVFFQILTSMLACTFVYIMCAFLHRIRAWYWHKYKYKGLLSWFSREQLLISNGIPSRERVPTSTMLKNSREIS